VLYCLSDEHDIRKKETIAINADTIFSLVLRRQKTVERGFLVTEHEGLMLMFESYEAQLTLPVFRDGK
jgi:hypothetical protein